jgi:hypothetical protein
VILKIQTVFIAKICGDSFANLVDLNLHERLCLFEHEYNAKNKCIVCLSQTKHLRCHTRSHNTMCFFDEQTGHLFKNI